MSRASTCEHAAREGADGRRRPEQPRVTRHAAERPGVLVVHLTDTAAGRATDRFRSARSVRAIPRGAPKCRSSALGHRCELPIETCAAGILEDEPEQHEPEVAVDRLRPGRVFERQRADRLGHVRAARVVAVERHPCRQAAAVLQEIADAHVGAITAAPSGQPRRHRIRQAKGLALHELHRERRGDDHLGERGEIEDRLFRCGRSAGLVESRPAAWRQLTPCSRPTSRTAAG